MTGAEGEISVTSVVHSAFMKHEELTGQIIGAAMAVLNELKPAWKRVMHGQPE